MKTIEILGKEFIITGKIFRIIRLKEEWDEDITEPEKFIEKIKTNKIKADVFTFVQRLPNIEPMYSYLMKRDNIAAIPISTYENWWTKQAFKQVRKNVRRSERRGVTVKVVKFDEELIRGIRDIYNETRIRQGTINKHYGKSFEETKQANITYLDRSDFIGAYLGNELIGFIKLVYAKNNVFARTMGIEGKIKYRGIGFMHALIAKAVETCVEKKVPYLVYGKFIYGSKGPDSLTEFKLYNGFKKIDLPRYYVPLNYWGKIICTLGLYKRLNEILPGPLLKLLLRTRRLYYEYRYRKDFRSNKKYFNEKE